MNWRNIQKGRENCFRLFGVHGDTVPEGTKKTVCIFDTETTGLDAKAKIIQFSGRKMTVTFKNGEWQASGIKDVNYYIDPEEKLPARITEITGITDEMLKGKPNEWILADEILSFVFDSDFIAGYNVSFDMRMLKQMCERTMRIPADIPYTDVLEMARDLLDRNVLSDFKLGTVADFVFPEKSYGFHDSSEDTEATADLFLYFLNRYTEHQDKDRTSLTPVHLERASLFINPNRKSQQRIKMHLTGYTPGTIYYDIVNKVWGCTSDTAAKRLFKTCDMADLERQMLEMYGYKFNLNTLDEIAKSWLKYRREIRKK